MQLQSKSSSLILEKPSKNNGIYGMKKFFALLLLVPCLCFAIDFGKLDSFGVHTLSHHEPEGGANNLNLGAYVHTDQGYLLGTYYNSWNRISVYAGWATTEWYRMNLSFVGVTNYWQPVTFIVIPSVRVFTTDSGMSLHLSGSPAKITEDGQSVIHLSLSWPIK